MDLQNDLRIIVEKMLDNYGLEYSDEDTIKEKLDRWLNTHFKLITPHPRELVFSEKINSIEISSEFTAAYHSIQKKLKEGTPVNEYLSKTVYIEDEPDYLFFDWGIYHLHLSEEPDPRETRFCKRTSSLLFLYITIEKAYFIDIRSHNEEYVFAQKELLQIIHDEWPELLESFKAKGFTMNENITNAEDIHKLRKGGALLFQKVGDDIYMPMGGGASTARTSLNVTTTSDRITMMVRELEKWVTDNYDDIIKKINLANPDITELDFKLLFNEQGFFLLEQNSKVFYRVQY